MKSFFILPLLFITSVCAETFALPFEAICDDTKIIVGKLQSLNETPITTGQTNDQAGTTMVLWMNMSNKSWTITATKKEITCIIGTGENLKFTKSKPTV